MIRSILVVRDNWALMAMLMGRGVMLRSSDLSTNNVLWGGLTTGSCCLASGLTAGTLAGVLSVLGAGWRLYGTKVLRN